MSWSSRILKVDASDFRSSVEALIRQQIETWPMLREAVAGLDEVQYKKLQVKGLDVYAQFNPNRIVSTGAKVDAATIQKRLCFLCVENLPPEEMGIPFGEEFVALCNPFPVLRNHLVISSRAHTPQTITGNFGTLLDLARELGDGWFTLYNGPRCGASAPDHLHFQACSREILPALQAVAAQTHPDDFPLLGLNALIERGGEHRLMEWFDLVLGFLSEMETSGDEPMINVVAAYDRDQWTVIVYPRRKHRPSAYDAEGDAKLTISPAAIDLSGVVVVPNPEHFARIAAADVERIYDEVLLDDDAFDDLLDRVIEEFV
ncbi:MAG: DUF4922 domain-containing protein [Blastocatellia bacterium]